MTAQTASSHLGKLMEGGLLSLAAQGRHRYYSLAGPQVAAMLESIIGVAAAVGPKRTRPGPREAVMREARICYDHLAGEHAVAMLDRFLARGVLVADGDEIGSANPARRISLRSASTPKSSASSAARSAAPAWTGACGDLTSPARWAPPSSTRSLRKNGQGAKPKAAPSCCRPRARWHSRRRFWFKRQRAGDSSPALILCFEPTRQPAD